MKKTILYKGSSDFNKYQIAETIHNGRKARVLYSGSNAPQSGIALDDDPELLFNYIQRFIEIIKSTSPKSILLIGGGAFTLPKAVIERFPSINIDVVEIDPLLPMLAKEYFELPSSNRLNVNVLDGREYLNKCNSKYDMILIDAFSNHEIPISLIELSATKEYARCLNEDGLIGINFIAKYDTYQTTLAHQLSATFKSVFMNVKLYPSDFREERRAKQNLLLIASNKTELSLDYLHSAPVALLVEPEGAVILGE